MDPREKNSDAWLDRQLRAVPLPDGFSDRLARALVTTNDALDGALRDVSLPVGLARRLRRIASDASRAGSPRPGRIPNRSLHSVARWWAAAAALFVAVSLAGLGSLALLLVTRQHDSPGADSTLAHRLPDLNLPQVEPPSIEMNRIVLESAETGPRGDAPREMKLAELPKPPHATTADQDLPAAWRVPSGLLSAQQPIDPLLDPTNSRWPVVQAHQAFDELPELRKLPGPTPQGMHVPLVPGFDLAFFIRAGVHPFIAPVHPKAQLVTVPLGVTTSSFELARRYVADGEQPPPQTIRTEEFLAAVDYRFPRPGNGGEPLAVQVAGGPSPFGQEGLRLAHGGETLRLLQVGVQARDLSHAKRPPMSLTLVVDVSASMAWEGRLDAVRRVLPQFTSEFDPADRLALVAFNDRAEVCLEDVGRNDARQITAAVARLAAKGSTNIGAGLAEAYSVARRADVPRDALRRVVLLTDGLCELDNNSLVLIRQRLVEAAARGIHLEVVDLRPAAESLDLQPQLEIFAHAGQGTVRRAVNADQIRWALLETLTGQPQLVARKVQLQVQFNPAVVAEYRLLGHEAVAAAGLLPAPTETDFLSGQSGTALFEVRLRTKGDDVGFVNVQWQDSLTGQSRSLVRKISRAQFAPTLMKAPLSLQSAAFAAEVAEVLRESPFARSAPNPGSLARARELLKQIDSRVAERGGIAELTALAQQAEQAKPFPRGARR
jgi:Ca-activated chloride channel family protein